MISIQNLTKEYDAQVRAVDNISFTVEKAQIAAIIGTSGCGKSTTLKMINRLVEPTAGVIQLNSDSSTEVDVISWRRKIGYVTQSAGLLPHLTVFENISLLSKVLKRDKKFINERVNELMELVNMPPEDFSSKYPAELSGGQRQRVGIARALMENPQILLMDEPFGALDPITRNSLHQELMDLNRKLEKTIIMITHDMEEAFKLADVIILMDQGKIIQMGSKEDFLHNPANQFVKNFVSGSL